MPEQELLGIDQHPARIFDGGPQIGAGLEVLGRGGELGGGGSAAEGNEVEISGDHLGGLATPGEPSDPAVVVVELAVDGRAADELEGLRQVRVHYREFHSDRTLAVRPAGRLAGQLSRRLCRASYSARGDASHRERRDAAAIAMRPMPSHA